MLWIVLRRTMTPNQSSLGPLRTTSPLGVTPGFRKDMPSFCVVAFVWRLLQTSDALHSRFEGEASKMLRFRLISSERLC